jgi:hypothetical protein
MAIGNFQRAVASGPLQHNVMDEVWRLAGQPNIGRRVIFDARLALTLRHHGVTEFATRNETHFTGFGFTHVWNPLATSPANIGSSQQPS